MLEIALDGSSRVQRIVLAVLAVLFGAVLLGLAVWSGPTFNPEAWIYLPLGLGLVVLGAGAALVRERLEIDAREVRRCAGIGARRVVARAALTDVTRVHVVTLGARLFVQIELASGPPIRLPPSPTADDDARAIRSRLTPAR